VQKQKLAIAVASITASNANLTKDFVKVNFDKSSNPAMDKARAEQWMNMYSILDRSTLEKEKPVFELIKESMSDFHLTSYLIDEVQIGSVDSVSKLWEDIFTTFPVDSRPIRFEYIARCILTAYTANCDDASSYNSRLSTAHKAQVVLGGNTTITVDDDFSQAEMMRGLAQQAVQQALKTEVQELEEELGNDYKAKQQVYRPMIARINREEREDEEGS